MKLLYPVLEIPQRQMARQDAWMSLGLTLLVLCAAPLEVRGSSGDLPLPPAPMRRDARLRLSVAGIGTFGLAREAPGGGAGVMGELGVTILDSVALLVHLELATSILSVIGSFGVMAEVALDDRFSLAVGGALSGFRDTCSCPGEFLGPTFPLRLSFAPHRRSEDQTARQGLVLGLQFAPGFTVLDAPSRPERFAFTTTLSVGYSVW